MQRLTPENKILLKVSINETEVQETKTLKELNFTQSLIDNEFFLDILDDEITDWAFEKIKINYEFI